MCLTVINHNLTVINMYQVYIKIEFYKHPSFISRDLKTLGFYVFLRYIEINDGTSSHKHSFFFLLVNFSGSQILGCFKLL